MELFFVDMGKVRLRVQTVPALDPVSHQGHTAYNVVWKDGEHMLCAPGWTLRDALETFCKWFQIERETISLLRPFLPQKDLEDGGMQ